jgi:hypothetical protein
VPEPTLASAFAAVLPLNRLRRLALYDFDVDARHLLSGEYVLLCANIVLCVI